MAVPTSYTEESIKEFMLRTLEGVGPSSAWNTNDFEEQLVDLLLLYEVDDIAEATAITKLRALARVVAWQKVVAATAGDFDFSADEAEYNRRVVFEHARMMLEEAERAAAEWLPKNWATQGTVTWEDDPYASIPLRGRAYFGWAYYG
jgi:hypothetical protein